MADIKGIKKSLKEAGEIATALGALFTAATILEPLMDVVLNKIDDNAKVRKDLIGVPTIYSKDHPLALEQAISILEKQGFKAEPIAVRKANIKFKNCFDLQVIGTDPKGKQKVKPGTLVFLRYVTSEVIKKSQNLFEESEKHKSEVKLKKANKRFEQKEENKKRIDDTVANVQQGVIDMTANTKNRIERIIPNRNKDKRSKERTDNMNDA